MLAEIIPSDVDSDVLAAELEVFANILSSGQLTQSGGLDNGEKVIKFVYEHRYALPLTRKSYKLMMTAPSTVTKDVQLSQISDHLMILKCFKYVGFKTKTLGKHLTLRTCFHRSSIVWTNLYYLDVKLLLYYSIKDWKSVCS